MYNWQNPEWPNFNYITQNIDNILYQYALEVSKLSAELKNLNTELKKDALIDFMVAEALKTSEIEGEIFEEEDIRSSIKNALGISASNHVKNPLAKGIAELIVISRDTYNEPLSKVMLCKWHEILFAESLNNQKMTIGNWRSAKDGPMQIISGPYGNEKVHFEAPPSESLEQEMGKYIDWYNQTCPTNGNIKLAGPIRAAISHIYFESIHPFTDGNGRIGRAIAEKALSQELGLPVVLSLSTVIHKNRKDYYQALSKASGYELNITFWVEFFVKTIYLAQIEANEKTSFIIKKSKFWKKFSCLLNVRQEKVMSRMLREGSEGFIGGLSAQKYMKIAECSKATATRDLTELLSLECIYQLEGRGRNTKYQIKI